MATPAVNASNEEEEMEDDCQDIRKQLFVEPETPLRPPPSQKEPILIYLRLRPKSQLEILSMDPDCLHPTSEHELVAVAPKSSKFYKNSRSTNESSQKFTFSRIFSPETTQKELFDETLRPLLGDFFGGQNCLVFTYGVTNSGKSYTVTGTPTKPGILPRTLDVIFNSLDPQRHLSEIKMCPQRFSELRYLTEEEIEMEQQWKDHVLKSARELGSRTTSPLPVEEDEIMDLSEEHDISSASTLSKASSNASNTDIDGVSFEEFQVCDDSCLDLKSLNDQKVAIFVSFAEIYNEFIYDLLVDTPVRRKSRTPLKIGQDKHQNYYIKGLHEVQVTDVEEAMLTLRLGLKHRHVASTRLNQHSSRSHSIYSIKMVKLPNVKRPTNAIINRISIVDLAGAERSSKTGTSGVRVKEAGNINTSLLTLGKCIEALKHNQNRRVTEERIIPFRDSKLTRLFQNYFIGRGERARHGKISMFINVSSNASVFDETYHVLKFSALTSKVITKVIVSQMPFTSSTCPPCTPRFQSTSHAVHTNQRKPQNSECPSYQDLEEKLSQCLIANKNEIARFRVELLEQECLIRQEVSQEFAEQLTEIEDRHNLEMDEQAEEYEDRCQRRCEIICKSVKKQLTRKRRRRDEDEESDGNLQNKMATLKDQVNELETELAMERKKASAELHDVSETYETNVVKLNQKLVEMSLLTQTLRTDLESKLKDKAERCDQLEITAEKFNKENSSMRAELETLRTKVQEESDSSERKTNLAELKLKELLIEKENWEKERLHFNSQIGELQKGGRCKEISDAECKPLTPASIRAVTTWHVERSCLTIRIEQLQQENSESLSKLAELKKELEDSGAENEILQARISELIQEKDERNGTGSSSPLRKELALLREELDKAKETLDIETASGQAKIASLQEELEKRVSSLTEELRKVQHTNNTLKSEMRETITHTLKEYENTVKSQSKHISELEAETHTLYSNNQELEEKNGELEIKLVRTNSSKDSLNLKIVQLSEQLEDIRRAASRRESELMDSSEQCRAMLEDQITSLRKQVATLEHDLSSAREDIKDTQQQLRKKEEELLSLIKSINGEKTVGSQLASALEEAQASMEALKGQHQLECAQLTIKVREITQQYEALLGTMETLTNQTDMENLHKTNLEALKKTHGEELKALTKKQNREMASLTRDIKHAEKKLSKAKSLESDLKDQRKLCSDLNAQLKESSMENEKLKEKVISLESQACHLIREEEEHIYEEPPNLSDRTIYDTVLDDTLSLTQIQSSTVVDKLTESTSTRRSYLQAIENKLPSQDKAELDHSKPHVHILERSSQLMEDTFIDQRERIEIDATPKPLRRTARKLRKRNVDENNPKESPVKKVKYSLRSRKKTPISPPTSHTIRDSEETDSLKDYTPLSLKRFANWTTGKKSKVRTPVTTVKSSIAERTRTRAKLVTKDQISAPISFIDSPMSKIQNRGNLGTISLGSRLIPEFM